MVAHGQLSVPACRDCCDSLDVIVSMPFADDESCFQCCNFENLTPFLQNLYEGAPDGCDLGKNWTATGVARWQSNVEEYLCTEIAPNEGLLSLTPIPTASPVIQPTSSPTTPTNEPTSSPTLPPFELGEDEGLSDQMLATLGALGAAFGAGFLFIVYKRINSNQGNTSPERPDVFVAPALSKGEMSTESGMSKGNRSLSARLGVIKEDLEQDTLPNFRVTYFFKAEHEDEMTVRAGDYVTGLKEVSPEWWFVRNIITGRDGLVPHAFMEEVIVETGLAADEDVGIEAGLVLNTPSVLGSNDPFKDGPSVFELDATSNTDVGDNLSEIITGNVTHYDVPDEGEDDIF